MTDLKDSQNDVEPVHLSMIFIELLEQLKSAVLAGNNKAALFHLLARLSAIVQKGSLIFWGTDSWKKVVCVTIQSPFYTPTFDIDVPNLVSESMGFSTRRLLQSIYSCKMPPYVLDEHTLSIDNLLCQQLMAMVRSKGDMRLVERSTAWYDDINAIDQLGLNMVRYRITPGAAVSLGIVKVRTEQAKVMPTAAPLKSAIIPEIDTPRETVDLAPGSYTGSVTEVGQKEER